MNYRRLHRPPTITLLSRSNVSNLDSHELIISTYKRFLGGKASFRLELQMLRIEHGSETNSATTCCTQ